METYLAQLWLAAQNCGWGDRSLALELEGSVLQTLLDLDPTDQSKLSMLTNALERRSGQRQSAKAARHKLTQRHRQPREGWGAMATELRLLTCQSYPNFRATEVDGLALHCFLQALQPETPLLPLLQKRPNRPPPAQAMQGPAVGKRANAAGSDETQFLVFFLCFATRAKLHSALLRAGEQNVHPQVSRMGEVSIYGQYIHPFTHTFTHQRQLAAMQGTNHNI